jgi:uncharacterized membrane protein YccF (DUF307 family)
MPQRSLLSRALWFALVGWWLTPLVVNVAWLLGVTVVLLPVSVKLVNLVPTALTLKSPETTVAPDGGASRASLPVRAVYFVFVGWWLALLWGNLASLLAVTVVGLPVAVWMLHRLPFVLSLYRYGA